MTDVDQRGAHRYRCKNSVSLLCDRGDGKPTRKRCRYCRGPLVVEAGAWVAIEFRRDGRYDYDRDALRTFTSAYRARAWVRRLPHRNVVAHFVPARPPAGPGIEDDPTAGRPAAIEPADG